MLKKMKCKKDNLDPDPIFSSADPGIKWIPRVAEQYHNTPFMIILELILVY